HGLPIGIKDLEETEGLLTTYGSPIYRGNVPAHDNALVARLRAAGAIVAGKTTVPEMGAGANSRNTVWGATGNPFNPLLNAGGSSGGS
ncbi:amidase family protein, partial [Acinetobacter baumannii]